VDQFSPKTLSSAIDATAASSPDKFGAVSARAGVPAEDAVQPPERLEMHGHAVRLLLQSLCPARRRGLAPRRRATPGIAILVFAAYEIIVTAFACTMARYFLNVWATQIQALHAAHHSNGR